MAQYIAVMETNLYFCSLFRHLNDKAQKYGQDAGKNKGQ